MDIEIHEAEDDHGLHAAISAAALNKLPPGRWKLRKAITLTPGQNRIGIDTTQAIADIETKGRHVWRTAIKFEEG